jgi:hypothetical protein
MLKNYILNDKGVATKLYRWEHDYIAKLDKEKIPLSNVQGIVDYVWENEGLKYPPRVMLLDDEDSNVEACADRLVVMFKPTVYTWVILHELSHSMTCTPDGLHNGHGSLFCGVYVYLLNKYMKVDMDYMRKSLRSRNITVEYDARPFHV